MRFYWTDIDKVRHYIPGQCIRGLIIQNKRPDKVYIAISEIAQAISQYGHSWWNDYLFYQIYLALRKGGTIIVIKE